MSVIQEIDYAINVTQVLLWQYNQATNLTALIQGQLIDGEYVGGKQPWLDAYYTQFWENWYYEVFYLWNLTALIDPAPTPPQFPPAVSRLGISVWAAILGLELIITDNEGGTYLPFGFENHTTFDNAPFVDFDSLILSRDIQLFLLRLRAFQLISNGDVLEINQFMAILAPTYPGYTGTIYVQDNYNMTMTYVFTTALDENLEYALNQYDVLPRPAGVSASITVL